MRPHREKPETQNRRLEPTGLAKPGKTCRLMGTGPGLARQDAAGRVFRQFWNQTETFFRFEPAPLAGNPDLLLSLLTGHIAYLPPLLCTCNAMMYTHHQNNRCVTRFPGAPDAVAVDTMPGDVYAFLQPSATCYFSGIAIDRMPPSHHICLALRCRHVLQYSLHFRYIACRCICFAIIVFFRSEIYCPIFTLSTTMPSVLHILH